MGACCTQESGASVSVHVELRHRIAADRYRETLPPDAAADLDVAEVIAQVIADREAERDALKKALATANECLDEYHQMNLRSEWDLITKERDALKEEAKFLRDHIKRMQARERRKTMRGRHPR